MEEVQKKVEQEVCKISKKKYTVTITVPENSLRKEDLCMLIYQYAMDELKYNT